jgi:dipeptidyl aminopeptidase/acylaminoacyl peptidase
MGAGWVLPQARAQAPAAAPAVALFFQPPALRRAQLSVDGSKLAMTVTAKSDGFARLAVMDLTTLQSKAIAAIDASDIDHIHWVDDEFLVFDTDWRLTGYQRTDFGPGLFSVDWQGTVIRGLVDTRGRPPDGQDRGVLPHGYGLSELPLWPAGSEVLVARPEEVSDQKIGHYSLQWVNARTRNAREVNLPSNSGAWAFDAKGQLRAVRVLEREHSELRWRDDAGAWRVANRVPRWEGSPWWPLWVDEADQLYLSAGHQGRQALFKFDLKGGRLSPQPVAAHPQFDVHARLVLRAGRVAGYRYLIDAEVTQWLDPQAEAIQQRIDRLLPAAVNRLHFAHRGNSPWVQVDNFSDRQPLRTLLYNTETQRLMRVGDSRPGIEPARMGSTDLHWVAARDGRKLPVWLTLPPGRPGQAHLPMPMVVLVHGGPWARGRAWRWDAEVQFLASRGYAVLEPEFRGSTGYGQEHFAAGWKQWGQAMQTDLADAARWAIAQKHADARRVALMGASYGGYATLMGLVQEPELFKAGVAWAAVSDLELLFKLRWSDFTAETRELDLPRLVGDPKSDQAMLRAHSPLRLADRLRNPLLLAHGEWDARVPMDHAEALLQALRPHNKDLEWVHYKDDAHGWSKPANAIDFWQRVERFLAKHLGA